MLCFVRMPCFCCCCFFFFLGGGGGGGPGGWLVKTNEQTKIFQFGVIGTANNLEAASIKDVFFFYQSSSIGVHVKSGFDLSVKTTTAKQNGKKYTLRYIVKSF